jgi:uncharacterized protein (DUF952 family)
MILHITTQKTWEQALREGTYTDPSLKTDGFIHCSTLSQVVDTANNFFAGQKDLILLYIDEAKLTSECLFEPPSLIPDNQQNIPAENMFPHVYGPVNLSSVIKVIDFPSDKNGNFMLPEEITIS